METNYTTTALGFDLKVNNKVVFTIHYYDAAISTELRDENLTKLKEWLFDEKQATYTHPSNRDYGWLSAEFESGGNSSCAVGYDIDGGCSYGEHQIATRTGTMQKFVTWLNENSNNKYTQFTAGLINDAKTKNSKTTCTSCDFGVQWSSLCNNEVFVKWQKDYIIVSHFQPLQDALIGSLGTTTLFSNMTTINEEAFIEMCISLSVQHGKALNIFQKALLTDFSGCSSKDIIDKNSGCISSSNDYTSLNFSDATNLNSMTNTANSISMTTLIDRIYAARKIYLISINLAGAESIINNRYTQESILLKQTLGL